MKYLLYAFLVFLLPFQAIGQTQSVARQWNEVLLEAIRNDFARPTIHARNLWHISAAMYDAWASFEEAAHPYFLGNTVHGYSILFEGINFDSSEKETLQNEAISYASYRLMNHRFAEAPGYEHIKQLTDGLMNDLGYDINFIDEDYSTGSAAALGNYIAQQIKLYGYQDGANEIGNYTNLHYQPVNEPLDLSVKGGENYLKFPNRWQPLKFETFIDQSGNEIDGKTIGFLSPEWGDVDAFAVSDIDSEQLSRDGETYNIYNNPGNPPLIDSLNNLGIEDQYKWGFLLVAIWSGLLDPSDGVMWDISPASLGNIDFSELPTSLDDYSDFYDLLNGGDISQGYEVNPITNVPYTPQIVNRGDYARVLAEFWADGPNSETPPGHWFVITNYVMDQPEFEPKWEGTKELDQLEFDVRTYFTLGGAMHDAAVSAWSIKGYYDYTRPISAIRFMATRGQSTDKALPNYDSMGMPLIDGYVELIKAGDPLAGVGDENVDKIKLKAWRGPDYINDPAVDEAKVGWIMATDWWPYQRPTFVTPPFAGFISGHSTFSRTAAEVLTRITGSEYFPGGMGEFEAPKNEFLVFEEGPSMDVTLQWAKYNDASDQCSLSRIWGGIHPPADDMPGRIIGKKIGKDAFDFASLYFGDQVTSTTNKIENQKTIIYPTPAMKFVTVVGGIPKDITNVSLVSLDGVKINVTNSVNTIGDRLVLNVPEINKGIYFITINSKVYGKVLIQ